MTAPALPGAAPDPARLPPEVVNEVALLFAKRRQYAPTMDGAHNPNPSEIKAAQEAVEIIARALGGDGEPVAWGIIDKDGVKMLDHPFRSREAAEAVKRECEAWRWPARAPFTLSPLYTRPAATGDTTDDAVRAAHRAEVERAVAERDEAMRAATANAETWRKFARERDALSARVAKLEAALRFYAEPSGYLPGARAVSVVSMDGGARARAALEEPRKGDSAERSEEDKP